MFDAAFATFSFHPILVCAGAAAAVALPALAVAAAMLRAPAESVTDAIEHLGWVGVEAHIPVEVMAFLAQAHDLSKF